MPTRARSKLTRRQDDDEGIGLGGQGVVQDTEAEAVAEPTDDDGYRDQLLAIRGVGPSTADAIVQAWPTPDDLAEADVNDLTDAGIRSDVAERVLAAMQPDGEEADQAPAEATQAGDVDPLVAKVAEVDPDAKPDATQQIRVTWAVYQRLRRLSRDVPDLTMTEVASHAINSWLEQHEPQIRRAQSHVEG